MTKQMPISKQDFEQMKQTNRIFIECIFQEEDSFKKKFIDGYWGWAKQEYKFERVHLTGDVVRISVRFHENGSSINSYYLLDEVYAWMEETVANLSN